MPSPSPRGLEPRHLAALDAVRREASFRGAAERLGYVQSAVSQQISQLEALVGVQLVDRSRGQPGVALTNAGLTMADHAEAVLHQLGAASADLRLLAQAQRTLHVGAFESVAARLLPPALTRLARQRPGLHVVVHESPRVEEHFRLVANGQLDAAFAELPLESGPFARHEVIRDPCVLVVPSASPLAQRREPLRLHDLAELPLILDAAWVMSDLIETTLRAMGYELRIALRSQDNATIRAMVAADAGVAIMPRFAVDPCDPRITALGLDHLFPTRRVMLFWHAHRRRAEPLIRDLIDAMCVYLEPCGCPEPGRIVA